MFKCMITKMNQKKLSLCDRFESLNDVEVKATVSIKSNKTQKFCFRTSNTSRVTSDTV